jgi:hypothetical protein
MLRKLTVHPNVSSQLSVVANKDELKTKEIEKDAYTLDSDDGLSWRLYLALRSYGSGDCGQVGR